MKGTGQARAVATGSPGGSASEGNNDSLSDDNNLDDDVELTDADKAFLDYLAKGAVRLYLARQGSHRGGHGP